ncbi:MAG: lamin tail domain-containing protein [bacterium]|nr:lamin tail domain-containing protein [bacterium]
MKYLLLGIILFLFSLSSVNQVFAGDVVINEFLVDPDASQWVELYNKGTATTDISGWFIDDNGGTQKFTIPAGTSINPGEFKVFESGLFNFNRTTLDVAQLLNGASTEDSYSYNSGPGADKSFGRQIDGTGDWVVFSVPTKGSTNNTSTPAPTLTPTSVPTNTPVPTATTAPTPTKTPTPTPTKTPTPTPTPKSVSSGGSGATATPKPTLPPTSAPTKTLALSSQAVEGTGTPSPTTSKKPTPTPLRKASRGTVAILGVAQNNLSKILVGLGAIFLLACGILAFRYYKKTKNVDVH